MDMFHGISAVAPADQIRQQTFNILSQRESLSVFCGATTYFPDDPSTDGRMRVLLHSRNGYGYDHYGQEPTSFTFDRGLLGFYFSHTSGKDGPPTTTDCFGFDPARAIGHSSYSSRTFLEIPWWFFAFLFSIAPLRGFRRWRRSRRHVPGTCRECGYDLRASPEAGGPLLAVCPECGRSPVDGGGHHFNSVR